MIPKPPHNVIGDFSAPAPTGAGAEAASQTRPRWSTGLWLVLALLFAPIAPAQPTDPAAVQIQSGISAREITAGQYPQGIIFSAHTEQAPAFFTWTINGRPLAALESAWGTIGGNRRKGIIVYTPPTTLPGGVREISLVATAHYDGFTRQSPPLVLPFRAPSVAPSASASVRTDGTPLSPSCQTVLEQLNAQLATYRKLLREERRHQPRNTAIIRVLTRIRGLADQARQCTGHNLGMLDKLQINLMNRLSVLLKDKARDLWREYDRLLETLRRANRRDASDDERAAIFRDIIDLQMKIKGMYEQYDMDMSQGILERLAADNRMLRKALGLQGDTSN